MLLGMALGVGVVVQLFIPNSMPVIAGTPTVMRSHSATVQIFAQTPDFASISLHPLFTPNRAQGDGGATPDGPLSLVGLAVTGGRASVVLRTQDGADHVLGSGETLTGWRLIAIGASSAELQRGAETQVLRVGAGAAAAAPTVQASSPPQLPQGPVPQGPPGGHFH